jgi:adenylosuccinate lyase
MLTSISPLDGRYKNEVRDLALFFSEEALMKYRLKIEIEYLIALSRETAITNLNPLSSAKQSQLRDLYKHFSTTGAQAIKRIESRINHDVKAVEYYLRNQLEGTRLAHLIPWCHFALTSEDVNNLSYSLMWRDGLIHIYLPALKKVRNRVRKLAQQYRDQPLLALTHGQPASPTTFGKEYAVYVHRINRQLEFFQQHVLLGKFGGATGTFGAHVSALPDVNWIRFARRFIKSLKFEPNLLTTQIEPHDSLTESYHGLVRVNSILTDFCRDIWQYISRGVLAQRNISGEVGSSTMPHKINPIQFENAEGNLGISSALLIHMSQKLPKSRLQRDLSDSTVIRNQGTAQGYSLLGVKNILKGLDRTVLDPQAASLELNDHWEVLAEALQTVLRRTGKSDAFEQLKNITKGQRMTQKQWLEIVDGLNLSEPYRTTLTELTPQSYTGLAEKLVELI